jgi:hypothetical protein
MDRIVNHRNAEILESHVQSIADAQKITSYTARVGVRFYYGETVRIRFESFEREKFPRSEGRLAPISEEVYT